jgi:hypothetical protein
MTKDMMLLPKVRSNCKNCNATYYENFLNEFGLYIIMEKDGRKDRRNKLQIYYAILNAIKEEKTSGIVKPTRVQFLCNCHMTD